MSRSFNGTNAQVRCSQGSISTAGAISVFSIFKKTVDGTWQTLSAVHNGSANPGDSYVGLIIGADNTLRMDINGAKSIKSTTTVTVADGWCLGGFTYAAAGGGTSTPTFYLYRLDAGTWKTSSAGEAGDADWTQPTTAAGGEMRFGAYEYGDYSSSLRSLDGYWNSQLNAANVAALFANKRSTDWTTHAVAPADAWEWEQNPVANLADLTGHGANEVARVGTTYSSDNPVGWVYASAGTTYTRTGTSIVGP